MASQVEQLNDVIQQARDACEEAQERAQEAVAADQQAQREADRVEVLESQREHAEHADNLPAYEGTGTGF